MQRARTRVRASASRPSSVKAHALRPSSVQRALSGFEHGDDLATAGGVALHLVAVEDARHEMLGLELERRARLEAHAAARAERQPAARRDPVEDVARALPG